MATIKDIAKLTNFSVSTISKAFNGYDEIPEATREKIFAVAKELNYVPNKNAVQLSGNSPKYIGFFIRDLAFDISTYELQFKILSGIMKGCNENKKELLIFTVENIKDSNLSFSNFCKYHNLSGAIIHGLEVDDILIKDIETIKIPVILIDMNLNNPNTSSITTNSFDACADVFKMLYNKGHRNMLYISGTQEAEISYIRENGFLNAIQKYSKNDCNIYKVQGDFLEEKAYEQVKLFLTNNKDKNITSIFAFSDFMCIGASRAVTERGYTVGKDISLIGFDGSEITNYTTPKLATVVQDFEKIGEECINNIVSLSSNLKHKNINVPYKILLKDSIHNVK